MVPPPDTSVLQRPGPLPPNADADRWEVPAGHANRYRRGSRPLGPTPAGAPQEERGQRLRLASGVELLGRSEGSGYIDEHHLARTQSGRIVQLTDLLFLIAQAAGKDGADDEAVAQAVTEQHGRTVTADNVRTLADKLRPLGILANADGSEPDVTEPDPLLALRLRSTLLGPKGVRRLTAPLRLLFFMPIVVVALAGLVALDLWLFLSHGLAAGLRDSMAHPALFLLAFGLVVVSAAFHECGHATACTVGGGKPGRMGAGIYLAWPAFYTDVTDVYRLDKKARLRTDLGGVYFSCLLVLALGAIYSATRFEPLLLIAFLMQIEVVHQMLPFLRLDGYYVVSDLVGVPDLFRRTGPVLKSMVPGTKPEPSVLELKPWVRNVVRAWVLIVVPVLLFNVGMIMLNFPQMLATAWDSAAKLIGQMSEGGVTVVINSIQLVFLVIPILGLGYTFTKLFGQLGRRGWTATAGKPGRRGAFLLLSAVALAALALTWWPDARYTPYREGQRGTIGDQGRALSQVGQGSPLFRSPTQAQQPLPALPPKLAAAYLRDGSSGADTPATGGGSTGGSTVTGTQNRSGSSNGTTPSPGVSLAPVAPSADPASIPQPATGTTAQTASPTQTPTGEASTAPTAGPGGTSTGTGSTTSTTDSTSTIPSPQPSP